jgi:propionyl-CoA carboxylase alpha chain
LFDKILIANRGEIACRVIRSCQDMGVKTVAVYSAADEGAEHVRRADEALAIGPAASAESYLVIDKILEACRKSGAQAVHPGFGFLAENAAFVEALEAAGIVFIGPGTKAIAAMGDKITSKKLADKAKVSTVPGHMDLIADAEEAVKIAGSIGFPVMIKASAGGGGKGMRVAGNAAEAREGFRSAQSEARSSFGDERIFIEKFIEEPRHIEIQVLADGHGNCIHLGERECSIQRRHQKVIEEAPSPFLDAETRAAMGAQAVALARAVDYRSAGTVEFIVDKDKNFYFLEMNTRIQVEHPVTELVTGLDIVAWMIRIAAGEKLELRQEDVALEGWAIEARVYAEDPTRNFMPSIGRLVRYREPADQDLDQAGGIRVRVDSGVIEGSEISMYYDPMIAKLVTHGENRAAAIDGMMAALDAFYIRGIAHNMGFLAAVVDHPRFREGRLTTNFIADEFPEGFEGAVPDDAARADLITLAAVLLHRRTTRGDEEHAERSWVVQADGAFHPRRVRSRAEGFDVTDASGATVLVEVETRIADPLVRCRIAGRPRTVQVDRIGPRRRLSHRGAALDTLVVTPRAAELAALMPVKAPPDMSRFLLSPMPGLLVSLFVTEGQEVKAGEELAVVEAMKMENILRAERDGKVSEIHAQPGASLSVDQAIIEFA